MTKPRSRGPTLAKDINRKRVYEWIKRKGRTSRVEVANELHLNKNTVNAIVLELAEAGFVRDIGQQDTDKAGRKPIILEYHAANKWAVGAQLTSTVVHWAVTDLYANPVETFSEILTDSSPESVVELLSATVRKLVDKYGNDGCLGLCVGIPGLMDATEQTIRSSHLNWFDVPILSMLRATIELPLMIDNSVKLASLGELWHGSGRGVDHFVYCYFGNGVGCSLVVNRSVARGDANLAGELGHFVMDPEGPLCGCGNRGCLEAYVSLPALLRRLGSHLPDKIGALTMDTLMEHLSAQDRIAQQECEQAARLIGRALSYVANLLNPRLILLDGPLMQASDWMFPAIQAELLAKCLPATARHITLARSELYPWASCIGAAASAIQAWENDAPVFA